MEWKKLLRQPAFQVFLFLLCLTLFNWPFLTIVPPDHQAQLFLFIYSAWGLVILLLFLVSLFVGDVDV